jgi:hypothetical protein
MQKVVGQRHSGIEKNLAIDLAIEGESGRLRTKDKAAAATEFISPGPFQRQL